MPAGGEALRDGDEVLLGPAGLRVVQVAPVEQEDTQGHLTSRIRGAGTGPDSAGYHARVRSEPRRRYRTPRALGPALPVLPDRADRAGPLLQRPRAGHRRADPSTTPLAGRTVVDVGAGPAGVPARLRRRGRATSRSTPTCRHCTTVPRHRAVAGPWRAAAASPTAVADIVVSSNVMEHVRGARRARAPRCSGSRVPGDWSSSPTRPGLPVGWPRDLARGTGSVASTPRGATPVGTATRRRTATGGPCTRPGSRTACAWARARHDAGSSKPCRATTPTGPGVVSDVPGLREVAAWNLLLVLRRR